MRLCLLKEGNETYPFPQESHLYFGFLFGRFRFGTSGFVKSRVLFFGNFLGLEFSISEKLANELALQEIVVSSAVTKREPGFFITSPQMG